MRLTRCFLAIEYPAEIVERIQKFVLSAQQAAPPGTVRWTSTNNMHLTVKFLGEIPDEQVEDVRTKVRQSTVQTPPLLIQVSGSGMFPSDRRPRILWVGTNEPEELIRLAGECDNACASAGIPKEERPFKAHLTIGRVKPDLPDSQLCSLGERFLSLPKPDMGKFTVDYLVLFRSELRTSGPIYTPIEVFPFRQP
jgi:2'-5' RNA ligase